MQNKKRNLFTAILGFFVLLFMVFIYKQDSLDLRHNTLQGDVRYVAAPVRSSSLKSTPIVTGVNTTHSIKAGAVQSKPKTDLKIRAKAICGNSIVEMGEQCDGGENCTNQCQFEFTTVEQPLETYFNEILTHIIPKETNEYQVPTNSELLSFKAALQSFLDEDYHQNANAFGLLGYKVIRLVDTSNNNQVHYVIQEDHLDNQNHFEKGWGTLFIKEGEDDGVFLSVPHPKFDENTPYFGLKAYQSLGEALYVAGSHRNANAAPSLIQPDKNISDQVHNDHILSVIGQVFANGVTDKFIEFHGHKTSSYSVLVDGGYKAVISGGSASSTTLFQLSFLEKLKQNSFDNPGGCGEDFNNILCGTNNRLKAAIGNDDFLHIELGTVPRDNYQTNAPIVANSIFESI